MLDGYLSAAVDLYHLAPVPAVIGIAVLCAGAIWLMYQA